VRQEGRQHPPQPGAQLVQPEPLPALQLVPALELQLVLQLVLLARRPGAYPPQ